MTTDVVRALDLPETTRDFIAGFHTRNPLPKGDPGLAIFFRRADDTFAFVEDAFVPAARSGGAFRKEAPKELYRGGVNGFIVNSDGLLTVSDERSEWFKPFPSGLVHRDEGYNLLYAAYREFSEEVSVFRVDREAYYIPHGIPPDFKSSFNGGEIGIKLKSEEPIEVGKLNILGYFVNKPEKILELHFRWDITELTASYSILLTEDWWQGGWPGIPVTVLSLSPEKQPASTGQVVGWYAGQQGFVRPDWKLHPSVKNFLGPKEYIPYAQPNEAVTG